MKIDYLATGNLPKSFSGIKVSSSTKIHIVQGAQVTNNKSQKFERYAKLPEEVREKNNNNKYK